MVDDFKLRMWVLGYMCFRMSPTKYKLRGEYGTMEVWPLLGKWKQYGAVQATDDLVATIQATLAPCPPERTPEQERAHELHLGAMEEIVSAIHSSARRR